MKFEIATIKFLVSKVMTKTEVDRCRDAFEAVIPKPGKAATLTVAKPIDRTSKADLIARFPILASGK
jgi:hypothetical protein